MGFVHIAGWVQKKDAPAIRRKIADSRDVIEAIKRTERNKNPVNQPNDDV